MEQRRPTLLDERMRVARGADDQLAALERLWAEGERSDAQADEAAWQTLRSSLGASRRIVGAHPLFPDE